MAVKRLNIVRARTFARSRLTSTDPKSLPPNLTCFKYFSNLGANEDAMNEEVTMQGKALYIFYRSINLNEEHYPRFLEGAQRAISFQNVHQLNDCQNCGLWFVKEELDQNQ